jgi:acyl-CoA synthetase
VEAAAAPRVVGVYASPSVEYIAAVLAVLRCGEAFLPLDPSWPEERIRWATSSSNAVLVVSSGGLGAAHVFASSSCSVIHMDDDLWQVFEDEKGGIGRDELAWPCEYKKPREFCYVMFTSGSTGKPKGVCGTEKGNVTAPCFWFTVSSMLSFRNFASDMAKELVDMSLDALLEKE